MNSSRFEAFSDGVIAVLITIMALELRAPEGGSLAALQPLLPVFASYLISFVIIGIYWNNHHHLLKTTKTINANIMWANLHLLFWLSLIPFATAWLGGHPGGTWPTAVYGVALFMPGLAFRFLLSAIISHQGRDSAVAQAVGGDAKGFISLFIYLTAIPLAFFYPWVSYALYAGVAVVWFIPDKRVEEIGRTQGPSE